ncbi:MAG: hypothetical protein MJZ34_03185 [Paludibacteraceae bacterium]|nr:hypothetical protein [Paludibacteraceae bacterium]
MKYIKRRLETVDAVRYDGEVSDDLIQILDHKEGLFYFVYADLYIYKRYCNKPHLVKPGEMVVCDESGLLDVIDFDEFNCNYKELNNESIKVDLAISTESCGILLN